MSKSKTPPHSLTHSLSDSVTGVGIELSQTKIWTAKNSANMCVKVARVKY